MRIALLTYSTRPRGGVVHTLCLAEALVDTGAEVTVVSLARGGDEGFFRPVDPRVEVRLVPFPDLDLPDRDDEPVGDRILRSIEVLADGLADVEAAADVVHAQDCITANAMRGRCVRTVHHLDTFTTPELAACHERAITQPSTLVCVSAAVAQEVRDGWDRTPTVIPNGVEAPRFTAAAASDPSAVAARTMWRDRLGVDRWVLAVGGIEPRKGSLDLVRAMAVLRDRHGLGDVPLVVAGGETLFDYRDYRAEVDAVAAELGVTPIVLGPVAHEELPALMAASAAFAFPSTKEGFGLAAMEALAAGVPVVTRDLPVLREVFGDVVTYFSDVAGLAAGLAAAVEGHRGGDTPDGEAGAATAAGGMVADGMVADGMALADAHTWAAAADRHLALYRRVLAGR